jgi:hypothetical protein
MYKKRFARKITLEQYNWEKVRHTEKPEKHVMLCMIQLQEELYVIWSSEKHVRYSSRRNCMLTGVLKNMYDTALGGTVC